jgi:hypothetical protein
MISRPLIIKAPSSGGFNTCMTNVLADDGLETVMGSIASHDS